MTVVSQLKGYIGKIGTIQESRGLTIKVKIKDVQEQWGRTRYLVTPVAGDGETWVENIRVEVK